MFKQIINDMMQLAGVRIVNALWGPSGGMASLAKLRLATQFSRHTHRK